jgi:hypothetical protein
VRKQRLFVITACIVVGALSGCRHRPVSTTIAVLQDLQTASVYADKNGIIRWDDTDINLGKFQIVFFDNPCEAKDVLHTVSGSEVVCHVTKTGTFAYQVLPYNGTSAPSPDPTKGAFSFAQVGGCTGCGRSTLEANAPPMKTRSSITPDHLALIACDQGHNNVAIEIRLSSAPFTENQKLQWQLNGSPAGSPSYGATFNQTSPCNEGTGPLQFCTIMQGTSTKTFRYTVSRSDCSSASSPYNFTVQ